METLQKQQKRRSSDQQIIEQINAEYGLMPPMAADIEEAVLGAVLLEKEAFIGVSDMLKSEYFYNESHQKIFEAVIQLFSSERPIDILTVAEQLKSNGTLEQIGGVIFLTELTKKVASAAHLQFHAQIIIHKYIRRKLIEVSTEIQRNSYDDGMSVDDLINNSESALFSVAEGQLGKDSRHIKDILEDSLRSIDNARNGEDGLSGISTGFEAMNKMTAGWQKTDLVILAARPAMGKTAFVLSMARNMAMNNQSIVFFSLEMSSTQLVNRLIAAETELGGDKLKKGDLNEADWQLINEKIHLLEKAPIFIDDTPALSVFELRAKCRRLKSQHDIQCVIIDYLQLMTASSKTNSREQEVSAISRSLKTIAKELDVPVIALSQLNRSVESREGRRPQLSDLRESGAIEQDADMVLFIHRPEYYGIDQDEEGNSLHGVAEVIIAKHRNGPTGDVRLHFQSNLAKFGEFEQFDRMETEATKVFSSKMNAPMPVDYGGDISNRFPSGGAQSFEEDVPF